MYKLQLSEESLNRGAGDTSKNINTNGKPKLPKQNDSKYLNAIKPYISKQRKTSKRDITRNVVSSDHSRSKSKKYDYSIRVHQGINKNVSEMYTQLINLKSDYQTLKMAYNTLAKEKDKVSTKRNLQKSVRSLSKIQHSLQFSHCQQTEKLKNQLLICTQQKQAHMRTVINCKGQIEILRSSLGQTHKKLQQQTLKSRKYQQTLQQKQLMIAFLRSQLSNNNVNIAPSINSISESINSSCFIFQNTAPVVNQSPQFCRNILVSQNLSLRQSHANNLNNQLRVNQSKQNYQKQIQCESFQKAGQVKNNIKFMNAPPRHCQLKVLSDSTINQQRLQLAGQNKYISQKIKISQQLQSHSRQQPFVSLNKENMHGLMIKAQQNSIIKSKKVKQTENKDKRRFINSNRKQKEVLAQRIDIKVNKQQKNHNKGSTRVQKAMQQDSLSFSRDKSKEFQSVHSLLSNTNEDDGDQDHTILSFTKKDVIILEVESSGSQPQSISQKCGERIFDQNQFSSIHKSDLQNINSSDIQQEGQEDCLTFDHRGYIDDINHVLGSCPNSGSSHRVNKKPPNQIHQIKQPKKSRDQSIDRKKAPKTKKKQAAKKKKQK